MTTGLEELQAFARWLDQHFARHEQEWARMRAARDAGQVPVPDPWWTDQDGRPAASHGQQADHGAYVALRAQIAAIQRIKTQVELRLLVLQGEADLAALEEEAAQERAEDYARWLSSGARQGTQHVQEDDDHGRPRAAQP